MNTYMVCERVKGLLSFVEETTGPAIVYAIASGILFKLHIYTQYTCVVCVC